MKTDRAPCSPQLVKPLHVASRHIRSYGYPSDEIPYAEVLDNGKDHVWARFLISDNAIFATHRSKNW